MGGKALKKTKTRRINISEFNLYSNELIKILSLTFNKVDIPKFYREKETFGDIDIIINKLDMDMLKYIEDTFSPNEIFHNDNVWSFDYKGVQIDLITTNEEDFSSTLNYMSWNDLGNFIGRLAQTIGLKFGQKGLFLKARYGSGKRRDIILTKDMSEILLLLDLDYDKWIHGFNTLEEMFEFIMGSKLFSNDLYQLSHLNKINRDRNKKRSSYMGFLEYIKGKGSNPDFNIKEVNSVRDNIQIISHKLFPDANVNIHLAELKYIEHLNNLVKLKFNGKILMDKYGFSGKELGVIIPGFKEYINGIYFELDFKGFIATYDSKFIYNLFEEYIKDHLNMEIK